MPICDKVKSLKKEGSGNAITKDQLMHQTSSKESRGGLGLYVIEILGPRGIKAKLSKSRETDRV